MDLPELAPGRPRDRVTGQVPHRLTGGALQALATS